MLGHRGPAVELLNPATDARYSVAYLAEAPGYGDAIRRAGALPALTAEEALLENAFTPVEYRGLGIMAVAVHLIAERASALGKRYLLAFVDMDNLASLKGVERAGLTPWSIRTRRQFGFGLLRTVRFAPIAATAGSGVRPVQGARLEGPGTGKVPATRRGGLARGRRRSFEPVTAVRRDVRRSTPQDTGRAVS